MKVIALMTLSILISCGKTTTEYVQGTQGQSCYSENVDGGINITCGTKTSFLPNGTNGVDGTFKGTIDLVEVCPRVNTQSNIETLLEIDGQYMAYINTNSGKSKNQTLIKLVEGTTYLTTDGRAVSFKITNSQVVCL